MTCICINLKGMQRFISKEAILNFLERGLFIVLCIASIWFAYGVLDNFFSMRTSFSQYEEKVYDYPVIGIKFQRKSSEVNLTDVEIQYGSIGMKPQLKKLEIGENHFHNEKYNKTETILLQNFKMYQEDLLSFRIISLTPILDENWGRLHVRVIHKNQDEDKFSLTGDLVYFYLTSLDNSPGFILDKWKDGKTMQIVLNKNTFAAYSIQPERYKYLKQTGKCQQESYYQCIGLNLDQVEFKECPKKCMPNIFSNLGINFSTPFCQNDTKNEDCALKIGEKIMKQKIGSNCQKSCSTLGYNGEVAINMPNPSTLNTSNIYFLVCSLANQDHMSKVYEEYLIYDAIGMIGSVGGTLGMFIGFSMTGTISWIFGYFKKCKTPLV